MKTSVRSFAVICSLLAVLGLGLCLVGCSSGGSDAGAQSSSAAAASSSEAAAQQEAASGSSAAADAAGAASGVDEALTLVGETKTKDEIEAILGPSNRFEMSSEGCERGVYAGIFYYDGYTVFSRTYDKGGTFTIVSASE